MKEILQQLSAYNLWANDLLCNTINALPVEVQTREVKSSFSTLMKTILHLWDAESIWWQRMKLQERIVLPGESFNGNMLDASEGLRQQDKQWDTWISSAQEHHLQHVFQYQNSKREQFRQPHYQMILLFSTMALITAASRNNAASTGG